MRSYGVVFLPLPNDRVTRGRRWGKERKLIKRRDKEERRDGKGGFVAKKRKVSA